MSLIRPQNTLLTMHPAVLYGPETWSVTLREDNTLGPFEKGMLEILCLPK
jgi:hypothetical protein